LNEGAGHDDGLSGNPLAASQVADTPPQLDFGTACETKGLPTLLPHSPSLRKLAWDIK
jgi:hypothetical protein